MVENRFRWIRTRPAWAVAAVVVGSAFVIGFSLGTSLRRGVDSKTNLGATAGGPVVVAETPDPLLTIGVGSASQLPTPAPALLTVEAILTAHARRTPTRTPSDPMPTALLVPSPPSDNPTPVLRTTANATTSTPPTQSPTSTPRVPPTSVSPSAVPLAAVPVGSTGGSGAFLRHSARYSDHWLPLPDGIPLVLLGSQAERDGAD
jgi:hypothetical protein